METESASTGTKPPDSAQYGGWAILAIWAAATTPMALFAWILAPWLMPRTALAPGIVYWLAIIAGMVWLFLLSLVLLFKERQDWTWHDLRERLWLRSPQSPQTARPNRHLYWVILPWIIAGFVLYDFLGVYIDAPMRWLFPDFRMPDYADIRSLSSPEYVGQWWLLVLALVSSLFNYVLGEALLFHGVLLPKMEGAFGRWAWLANAVLFGAYHVHLLSTLPSQIVSCIPYSCPAQRYRSAWLALAIHGFEGFVLIGAVLWVILGGPAAAL